MQQNMCQEKWVDAFLTKPDRDYEGEYVGDDTFVCAMQTVDLSTMDSINNTFPAGKLASIVNYKTCYLMPTFPAVYDQAQYGKHAFDNIVVGDNIRLGNARTANTDLLTVLEIIEVDRIYNMLPNGDHVPLTPVRLSALTNGVDLIDWTTTNEFSGTALTDPDKQLLGQLQPPTGLSKSIQDPYFDGDGAATTATIDYNGTSPPNASHFYTFKKTGIAHKVLRINVELIASQIPPNLIQTSTNTFAQFASLDDAYEQRHLAYVMPISASTSTNYAEVTYWTSTPSVQVAFTRQVLLKDDALPFPMYLEKDWIAHTTLKLPIDHRIKQIKEIRLIGYAAVNKHRNLVQTQDSLVNDDYFVMQIDEINGHVHSNNKYCDGSFAVLRMVSSEQADNTLHVYDPMGLVTYKFPIPLSNVRKLSVRFFDRRGNPAHIGRLHLWFRLLTEHG